MSRRGAEPRPSLDRRQFLLGGILLGGAGVAATARPQADPQPAGFLALEHAMPDRLGAYRYAAQLDVVLPQRDETSLRIYQRYVARTYVADGLAPIGLLIAYGGTQDYALQLHRPESCYPMAGYTVGPSRRVRILLAPGLAADAIALVAHRRGRQEQLLYWTRVGTAFPATLWEQRLVMLRAALARHLPDGVLVRLSMPVTGGDAVGGLARFNAALLESLAPEARAFLLAPPAATLSAAGAKV